ncbi:hypothetical protein J2X16_004866 [Pelomonas aquatica]|uniref:Uncharacterized protein n=1 Tax=Pelomonas aquatica TaxID=431058 RepID=A0ABU1ZIJ3_9BURK|nr:hypothetical protein [Pelomonas aquatica]MDR7299496.1 hypothetical protein [Pelomonas aquatica]
MRNHLPESSFVGFSAYKLKTAVSLWKNPELNLAGEPADFAFATLPESADEAEMPERRVLLAERYGGIGAGANGGGARCGLLGDVQLKGVGCNPLLGKYSDRAHSSGEVTLKEALREALWGEIYSRALPHGAVRVLGIAETGTDTIYREPLQPDGHSPRVIVLRQPVLRPAHYLRAVDFIPREQAKGLASDAARTIAAVQMIQGGLTGKPPATHGASPKSLNDGLRVMAGRMAAQVAASQVKRIPHGQLNCSNVALDGRFIDFWTATGVSDYGRIILGKGCPEYWRMHTSFHPTFANLLFYLRHYLPAEVGREILPAAELIKHYDDQYHRQVHIEFLKLTGLPAPAISALPPRLVNDFQAVVQRLIRRGNEEPFKYPQMPPVMGRFHLNSILKVSAFDIDPVVLNQRVKPLIDDDDLRERLAISICAVRKAYIAKQPGKRWLSRAYVGINAVRRNSEIAELYRFNLEPELVVRFYGAPDASEIASFIHHTVARAHWIHGEFKDSAIPLAQMGLPGVSLMPAGLHNTSGQTISKKSLLEAFSESHPEIPMALKEHA